MATATKKQTALATLEELEAEAVAAEEAANETSRKLTETRAALEELRSARWKLLNRDRRLVDENDLPVSADNPVAEIDRQVAELPDLDQVGREHDHLRLIQQQAYHRVRDYIADNYAQLVEDFRPRAESARDELMAALKVTREAAEHYIGTHNRAEGLTGPVPELTTRVVPGHEIHKLVEMIDDCDPPVPIQEAPTGGIG